MDPDAEIHTEFIPFFRLYKSGRIERLQRSPTVPPSSSDGVSSKDVAISPHLSARLYLPTNYQNAPAPAAAKLPILIYYHGGAFCIESAFSSVYHPHVTSLSARAHAVVVSVEYRLAPEHPLPAAHDDAWAALQWALSPSSDEWLEKHGDAGRVFLAGDSAGANLSHYAASRAASQSLPVAGIVLVHPYFGLPGNSENVKKAWEVMSRMAIDDPRHNPMANGGKGMTELRGDTKVLVAVAAKDILKVNGTEYLSSLKKNGWGGEAVMVETEDEGHVFHLFKQGSDKAEELMERIVGFINGK